MSPRHESADQFVARLEWEMAAWRFSGRGGKCPLSPAEVDVLVASDRVRLAAKKLARNINTNGDPR
jgi:hypothetical protein